MATKVSTQRLSLPLMLAFRGSRQSVAAQPGSGEAAALPKRRFAVKVAATERLVREEVLTDLSMLCNTIALGEAIDLSELPHARTSILNFGIPDVAARTINDQELSSICADLSAALRHFEPRLLSESIHVERDASLDSVSLNLRLRVRAELLCTPVNVPVEFVADMELETRKIRIEKL